LNGGVHGKVDRRFDAQACHKPPLEFNPRAQLTEVFA
jgi:hypothetical protein